MNRKFQTLLIVGFRLAAVNYMISGYQKAAPACAALAVIAGMDAAVKKHTGQLALGIFMAAAAEFTALLWMSKMLDDSMSFLILKVVCCQFVIDGLLLVHLCKSAGQSRLLLKYSTCFYALLCLISLLLPNQILDYFLYAQIKGNGSFRMIVLCSMIFVPLILCGLLGMVCTKAPCENKNPRHYLGSIR